MSLDAVRRTYTDWAPFYNPTHSWMLPKRRAARLALQLKPGEHVLDLACGTGLNFPDLRAMVGESGQVVGVDLTPAMLDIARSMIEAKGWKNVEVRETDAARLPFADASFDKALVTFALIVIPEYARAIEEIHRVLVPGGKFVALEMRSGNHGLCAWLAPLPHICAIDVSHDTLQEIRHRFKDVQVSRFWLRTLYMAVATKS